MSLLIKYFTRIFHQKYFTRRYP